MKKIDQINEKLDKGREKLKQIKERYQADSQKINKLIQERAGLLADEIIESSPERKKKIIGTNKEIDNLKSAIESSGPELIDALEKKIQGIESEKREEELTLSFERQKKLGSLIVDLSKRLIEGLEEVNSTNEELRKAWTLYGNIAKNSKKSGIKAGAKTTFGSLQSLKMLLGTLRHEYDTGKPRGSGEFNRIRI